MRDIRLETVEEVFREWRAHRGSCKEAIPENLWVMAIGLYPQYKKSEICQRLSLSGSQFKQRLEDSGTRLTDSGFVLASRDGVEPDLKSNTAVQLRIQSGARSLTLCVDAAMLNQVLPHLGALL